MIIHALNIPEETTHLPSWLEDHLQGLDLAALVSELKAVHGERSADDRSIEDVLGEYLPRVLEEGLSILPAALIRELMCDPILLLQLQVRVFVDGGEYWQNCGKSSDEVNQIIQRNWPGVKRFIEADAPCEDDATETNPIAERSQQVARRPWFSHPIIVFMATAAATVAAMIALEPHWNTKNQPAVVQTGWGWNKGVEGAQGADYLEELADQALEWKKKEVTKREDVANRISQYRQGCTKLINAEAHPLSKEDRDWLVNEKCKTWRDDIDAIAKRLEEGERPEQIVKEMDERVDAIHTALLKRAQEIRERETETGETA